METFIVSLLKVSLGQAVLSRSLLWRAQDLFSDTWHDGNVQPLSPTG